MSQTYEEAFGQLETLVQQLESGELPLEDSLKAYEKGIRLQKICQQKLQQAELKLEKINASIGEPADSC